MSSAIFGEINGTNYCDINTGIAMSILDKTFWFYAAQKCPFLFGLKSSINNSKVKDYIFARIP